MTTAASYEEIQRAKAELIKHGYQVSSHENGHLIVEDPVFRCGFGQQAGRLVPAGFKPVAIRSYLDAIRFVSVRS